MKVFLALCLVALAMAQDRGLISEGGKIMACESKGSEALCTSCCDTSFNSGLLAAMEKLACHGICKILPPPPQKRGVLDSAAKLGLCEATMHEAPCVACCDTSFTGLFGALERPACHIACKILPV